MNRVALVLMGIAALLLAACGNSTGENRFVQEVRSFMTFTSQHPVTDDEIVAAGYEACKGLELMADSDSNLTRGSLEGYFTSNGFTSTEATKVINAANANLCPDLSPYG